MLLQKRQLHPIASAVVTMSSSRSHQLFVPRAATCWTDPELTTRGLPARCCWDWDVLALQHYNASVTQSSRVCSGHTHNMSNNHLRATHNTKKQARHANKPQNDVNNILETNDASKNEQSDALSAGVPASVHKLFNQPNTQQTTTARTPPQQKSLPPRSQNLN